MFTTGDKLTIIIEGKLIGTFEVTESVEVIGTDIIDLMLKPVETEYTPAPTSPVTPSQPQGTKVLRTF